MCGKWIQQLPSVFHSNLLPRLLIAISVTLFAACCATYGPRSQALGQMKGVCIIHSNLQETGIDCNAAYMTRLRVGQALSGRKTKTLAL